MVIEALTVLLTIFLAVAFHVDIIRRAQFGVTLQNGAFFLARSRALGDGWKRSRSELRSSLLRSLGERKGDAVSRAIDVTEEAVPDGLEASIHYRYPAVMRFPYARGAKHHFEMTEKCRFFY